MTQIYLSRQKNDSVVCSPASQGDASSWVVFCPSARCACFGTKNHPALGISLLSRAAHSLFTFFVSPNKFSSPAAFFCNQISSKKVRCNRSDGPISLTNLYFSRNSLRASHITFCYKKVIFFPFQWPGSKSNT